MFNAVSALQGASFNDGIAEVRELGLRGMITLRGDLSDKKLVKSVSLSRFSFFFNRYFDFRILSGSTLRVAAISLVVKFIRKKAAKRISFSEMSA